MKKYFLVSLCTLFLCFGFSFGDSYDSLSETSCPVFLDELDDFGVQKLEMEYQKQQLKSDINDAYAKIRASSNKEEKELLKTQISIWKKEIIVLNYRLFLLYKNEYFSRIIH